MISVVSSAQSAPIVFPVDLTSVLGDAQFCEGLRAHWHPGEQIVEVIDTKGQPYWQEVAATDADARRALETIDAEEWQRWVDHEHGRSSTYAEFLANGGR